MGRQWRDSRPNLASTLSCRSCGQPGIQRRQIFLHTLEHGVIRARGLNRRDAHRSNRGRGRRRFRLLHDHGFSVSHRRRDKTFPALERLAGLTLIMFPELLIVLLGTNPSGLPADTI